MPVTNRYFVEPSGGTDSVAGVANGRDPLGLSVVNATYDHTGNGEGERHLFLTGAFTSYTFTAGDTIYLLNAAGGVTTGLYEIASKVDADAILLVADSGLTADSTSDVDSSDGPWLTTQFAADTVTATPSDVYLMSTAIETPSTTVAFDTNLNSLTNPIKFIGAGTTGIKLTTGVYTISGSSLPASTNLISITTSALHVFFERVRITGATSINVRMTGSVFLHLKTVRIDSASGHGVEQNASGAALLGIDSEFDSNGGRGISQTTTSRGRCFLTSCSIHDNSSDGIFLGAGIYLDLIEIYGNGAAGIQTDSSVTNVNSCTIFGNSTDGIKYRTTADFLSKLSNTTISSNGGYAVNTLGAGIQFSHSIGYNHTYSNTSGDIDTGDGTLPGNTNQTGDPQFTSTTNGSEDFIPASGSPLDRNGSLGVDIGARKAADPAGGGGGTVNLLHGKVA